MEWTILSSIIIEVCNKHSNLFCTIILNNNNLIIQLYSSYELTQVAQILFELIFFFFLKYKFFKNLILEKEGSVLVSNTIIVQKINKNMNQS